MDGREELRNDLEHRGLRELVAPAEDWKLDGDFLFRQFGLITLLLAARRFAAAMVVAALVFNLISDIIGGVWVSVIEEETALGPVGTKDPGATHRATRPDGRRWRVGPAVGYAGRPLSPGRQDGAIAQSVRAHP